MKTIYVYDLNMPSLMAFVCKEAKEKGVKIIRIDELTHLEDNYNYPLVINPLSSVCVEHWEAIKQFISNHNSDRKIIMVTPDYSEAELKAIIGLCPNIKIFGSRIDMEALLEELTEQ